MHTLVQTKTTRADRHNEKGVSLVETLIGLVVLTIVLLCAAQLFRVQVENLTLADRIRRADVQANTTMNTLASYDFSALPDGNPFSGKGANDSIADGEQVALNGAACVAQANCDQVVRWPQTSSTAFDYTTIGWNQPRPTGPAGMAPAVVYYRAWRVTTIDAAKRLRRITLVILPAEPNKTATDPIEPLALRQTNVVQRQ